MNTIKFESTCALSPALACCEGRERGNSRARGSGEKQAATGLPHYTKIAPPRGQGIRAPDLWTHARCWALWALWAPNPLKGVRPRNGQNCTLSLDGDAGQKLPAGSSGSRAE